MEKTIKNMMWNTWYDSAPPAPEPFETETEKIDIEDEHGDPTGEKGSVTFYKDGDTVTVTECDPRLDMETVEAYFHVRVYWEL